MKKELQNLLVKNPDFLVDGVLNKNKLAELARQYNPELLNILMSDEQISNHFFSTLETGSLVFKKDVFLQFLNNKEFLPDSFTAYKTKIGLATGDKYLSENQEVVLNFPYKDCVLEGGQTKDDAKRQEIFFNETFAPTEINRLLDDKVLTNFKRYDETGEHNVEEVKDTDNLIIKGNNLIALHSLKKRFAGKVKLIYIDPPYNTGNDGFKYNDSFNHSTWLTFMKNRLEIARELLADDGAIYVNLDYNEVHYCKVLMDEIFGKANFQREIIWRIGWVSGYKTSVNNYVRNHDTILFYSKNATQLNFNKHYIPNTQFKPLIKDDKKAKETFEKYGISATVKTQILNDLNFANRPERYPLEDVWNANEYDDLNSIAIVSFAGESVSKLLGGDDLKGQKSEKLLQRIIEAHTDENDIVLDFHLGSGTTAAVAHKMNRQYIGIEQMDYIETISVERLKKVIAGEQSGISKDTNWSGGGSFVYAELKNDAQDFKQAILDATNSEELLKLFELAKKSSFLSYRIDPKKLKANEFEKLSLAEQKQILSEIVDNNNLYVNYSDIDDVNNRVSDADKKLNYEFYGGEQNGL